MPKSLSDQPAAEDAGQLPSSGVRTAITYLLFLHLFALGVAVLSNFGAVSGLRLKLRDIPGVVPYLQLLNMDTSYGYQLVLGTDEDADFACDVVIDVPTSGAVPAGRQTVSLLPDGAWPGLRRRRYLMLSLNTAMNEGNEDTESYLPAALANGMLRVEGAKGGAHRFRCGGQRPPSIEDMRSGDPARQNAKDPRHYFMVYEAGLAPVGDHWEPSKLARQSEMTQSRRDVPGDR